MQNTIIIINASGISIYYNLENLGINEFAFPLQQALQVINYAELNLLPILGGDVYILEKDIISVTTDNWCYEHSNGETWKEYVSNSCQTARSYLCSYKSNTENNLFSIVIGNDYDQTET